MKAACTLAVVATALAWAAVARADSPPQQAAVTHRWTWFSGASRAIPHSMSASRDTAVFGASLGTYPGGSAGLDFALLALQLEEWTLRAGVFNMLDVESPCELALCAAHWRGLSGGSLALSADRIAAEYLGGERGRLEAALSFRHESEHVSVSPEEIERVALATTGDFFMPDVAMRLALPQVDLEWRAQLKIYWPHISQPTLFYGDEPGDEKLEADTAYSLAPAGDVIVRWRLHPALHLFWSTFFEYQLGRELTAHASCPMSAPDCAAFPEQLGQDQLIEVRVPDAYLLRSQLGVILPLDADPPWRRLGFDLQIFPFLEVGHRDGLLRYHEELRSGLGIRAVLLR